MEVEVAFANGAEAVGTELWVEYGSELLEFELDCKQAMLKPSKNLPTIDSAGVILP